MTETDDTDADDTSRMADRLDTIFWLAFAVFGIASLAVGASRVAGGDATLATWGQLAGGALVAGGATVALAGGEAVTGGSADVSPSVEVLTITGVIVYVFGVVVGFL